MQAREAILDIMKKQGVSLTGLASRLSITKETMWARLHDRPEKKQDMTMNKLVDTAKALDYKVVIVPRESRVPEGGYVVDNIGEGK